MDFLGVTAQQLTHRWQLTALAVLLLVAGSSLLAGEFYTQDNFPDADQKLEQLIAGQEKDTPYFVWRDAQGIMHTTRYEMHNNTTASAVAAPAEQGSRWSGALDIIRSVRDRETPSVEPDPQAVKRMGLSQADSPLTLFASHCCQQLTVSHRRPLSLDRWQGVSIVASSPADEFVTGNSRYFLLALPKSGEPQALRLRSFIDGGVFLPTLVFLDDQRQPVRMVTQIGFHHQPARWHRLGYLEALLPMAQDQPEKSAYVLVITRQQDLDSRTLVSTGEAGEGGWFNHLPGGELELKLFSR